MTAYDFLHHTVVLAETPAMAHLCSSRVGWKVHIEAWDLIAAMMCLCRGRPRRLQLHVRPGLAGRKDMKMLEVTAGHSSWSSMVSLINEHDYGSHTRCEDSVKGIFNVRYS